MINDIKVDFLKNMILVVIEFAISFFRVERHQLRIRFKQKAGWCMKKILRASIKICRSFLFKRREADPAPPYFIKRRLQGSFKYGTFFTTQMLSFIALYAVAKP